MPLIFLILILASVFILSVEYIRVEMHGGAEVKAEVYKKETNDTYPTLSAETYSFVEDLNGQLIRLCQLGQAMIIRCQECYASGRTDCPYPTNAFCQSARGANYNDPTLVWGFLPDTDGNGDGDLSLIWTYNDPNCPLDPSNPDADLTSINCLPQYIRLKARQVLDPTLVQLFRITYKRPTDANGTTDICAVDGVITDFSKKQ